MVVSDMMKNNNSTLKKNEKLLQWATKTFGREMKWRIRERILVGS